MSGTNRAKLHETLYTLSTERLWIILEQAAKNRLMALAAACLTELALRGERAEFVHTEHRARLEEPRPRPPEPE